MKCVFLHTWSCLDDFQDTIQKRGCRLSVVWPKTPSDLIIDQLDVFTKRIYGRGTPFPGLTTGQTDRHLFQPCIVSDRVGEEDRLSSGEKT